LLHRYKADTSSTNHIMGSFLMRMPGKKTCYRVWLQLSSIFYRQYSGKLMHTLTLYVFIPSSNVTQHREMSHFAHLGKVRNRDDVIWSK
jgi:hypothetical protein